MIARILFAAPYSFFALLPTSSAQLSAQDREWIAHCVSQISEANKPHAQAYCVCMVQSVDTLERMQQTDLECSFPPVHRLCFRKAGFK